MRWEGCLQPSELKQRHLAGLRDAVQAAGEAQLVHHALAHLAAHHVVLADEGTGLAGLHEGAGRRGADAGQGVDGGQDLALLDRKSVV